MMKIDLEGLGLEAFMKPHQASAGNQPSAEGKLPSKPQFSNMIYLDYAATTPVDPRVIEAMVNSMETDWANVSSPHELGIVTKQKVEADLDAIAAHFNVNRDELIITSGSTESINHALKGVLHAQKKKEIITSTIEHKATINTVQALMKEGYRGKFIAPNSEGIITAEMIEAVITDETAMISLIWVNNETGDKLPVEEIAKIARARKIPFHVDATQAAPHFQFDASQFDLVSVSAHKCYGPKAIGLLYRRSFPKLPMMPLIDGSGGQLGLRAGTIPNEGIAGFAKALEIIKDNWVEERHRLAKLESYLVQRLLSFGVEVNSGNLKGHREPGVLNLYIPNVNADTLMALTPKLAIAKGSACNSDSSLPSYVLTEMNYDLKRALSSVRISVGRYTTEEEIFAAGEMLSVAIEFIQNIADGKPANWYGEYDLYNSYIASILEPDYLEDGITINAGIDAPLLVIEKEHFSLTLYGKVEKVALDDSDAIRFTALSGKAYGEPYYLSLFNDLIIALRDETISSQLALEQLLGMKMPANYLRDTLFIEKSLRNFIAQQIES
ncbi:cysteine desulfurase [Ignatzschineria rhizosphaerae]|uniref:Cysteine desulfurase n=1 Tax=Ignatzschineria rhizosphaerae TaxID=2923279 RepID=A0ABY3X547_9GAMM|nr:cysteine desulfurase family protein [Ignatzschineria rhizosphaerae]UNM97400.1 cysteine desulfurase [Ignatzschineria rhizosphaerae]